MGHNINIKLKIANMPIVAIFPAVRSLMVRGLSTRPPAWSCVLTLVVARVTPVRCLHRGRAEHWEDSMTLLHITPSEVRLLQVKRGGMMRHRGRQCQAVTWIARGNWDIPNRREKGEIILRITLF